MPRAAEASPGLGHPRRVDKPPAAAKAWRPTRLAIAGLTLALATTAAAAAPSRLASIRARGELRWGADSQGGAPYVFQDPMDPNHLIGFEVELADALAARLGVRARPLQGQWEELLPLLARGDFDIALNGIEVAAEKLRAVDLSRPYYACPERLSRRRGDAAAPRTLAELRGRRVGTLPGSLAERILVRAGAEVRTYEGGQDAIYTDLALGRTDAVLLDEAVTRFYSDIDPRLESLDGDFGSVAYAIALPPGDAPLRAAIDDALLDLGRDGTLRAIYQRWGLWNQATATLLGDPRPAPSGVAEAYEAWRAAVGQPPPLWERIRHRYPKTVPLFLRGALVTLLVALVSMALAIGLGVLVALANRFGPRPLRLLGGAYVEFFRGTPLLVQLTMIYFGLPELGWRLSPFTAGCLALGLNYAAAEAENYRAGLDSVSSGQIEVAWSLGLSTAQTIRHVLLPQALRVALPPMTNDFVALLKDSSLVAVVTMTELNKTYLNLASSTRDHLGLGVIVSLWYLAIGLPFARLARYAEARLQRRVTRS